MKRERLDEGVASDTTRPSATEAAQIQTRVYRSESYRKRVLDETRAISWSAFPHVAEKIYFASHARYAHDIASSLTSEDAIGWAAL